MRMPQGLSGQRGSGRQHAGRLCRSCTSDLDYSPDELEFMLAMQAYETVEWANPSHLERGSRGTDRPRL